MAVKESKNIWSESSGADAYAYFRPVQGYFCAQVLLDNTDAVGTLYLQGSNDGENWADLGWYDNTDSWVTSFAVASGTDVNLIIETVALTKWVRVFYDRTSGGDGTTQVVEVLFNQRRL